MVIEIEPFTEGSTEPRALPAEETEDIELVLGNKGKLVKIGLRFKESFRASLINLLLVYADIFTWVPSDMPGINESVAVHKLCVDPARKPI